MHQGARAILYPDEGCAILCRNKYSISGGKMKIKFKVQMTQQYMYDFMLQHIYRSFQGVISLLAGLAVLTVCIATLGKVDTVYSVCYAFFALFFWVYLPLSLWWKAKHRILSNPMYSRPLEYEIDQRGIRTSQGKESSFVEWKQVHKVINSKLSVIVYVSKANACVLPKAAVGGKYDRLLEIMEKNVPQKKYKIRRK